MKLGLKIPLVKSDDDSKNATPKSLVRRRTKIVANLRSFLSFCAFLDFKAAYAYSLFKSINRGEYSTSSCCLVFFFIVSSLWLQFILQITEKCGIIYIFFLSMNLTCLLLFIFMRVERNS